MQQIRISLVGLLGWTILPAVAVGLIGIYPTWRLAALPGLQAELAAGAAVLAAMVAGALFMVRASAGGPAKAAHALIVVRWFRTLLCVVFLVSLWWCFALPRKALGVWAVVFYLAALGFESAWLYRKLTRPATPPADGAGPA